MVFKVKRAVSCSRRASPLVPSPMQALLPDFCLGKSCFSSWGSSKAMMPARAFFFFLGRANCVFPKPHHAVSIDLMGHYFVFVHIPIRLGNF